MRGYQAKNFAKHSWVLVIILLFPLTLFSQISKPGRQINTTRPTPKPSGPKKFDGKSIILVVINADGVLEVDFEKIGDFKKGETWKSNIVAGEHIVSLYSGESRWEESVSCKSGQQSIVRTKLQVGATPAVTSREPEISEVKTEQPEAPIKTRSKSNGVYRRSNVKKDMYDIKQVSAHSSAPRVDIRYSDGTLYKSVKAPNGCIGYKCMGFISSDEKYVYVQDEEYVSRINIDNNSIVSVPFKKTEQLGSGADFSMVTYMFMFGLHSGDSKIYVKSFHVGKGSDKEPITIYEIDFNRRTAREYWRFERSSSSFDVGASWHNNYVATINESGLVRIYDIETKTMVKEINLNVSRNDIRNREISSLNAWIYNGILTARYNGIDGANPSNNWSYSVEYDLIQNKKVRDVFRTSECYNAMEVKSYGDDSKVELTYAADYINKTTTFYRGETCSSEAFRIDGSVIHARFIDDNTLELKTIHVSSDATVTTRKGKYDVVGNRFVEGPSNVIDGY